MLLLQGVTYTHPDKTVLFTDIDLAINNGDKLALTGNNGAGKSTLLQLMAGSLSPAAGVIKRDGAAWYVPQLTDEYAGYTVAEALQVSDKIHALQQILAGNVTEAYLTILDDDWAIEERVQEALQYWDLDELTPDRSMASLSGGQRTKVLLAGIQIHKPDMVLLDEPTNHLDSTSRRRLYDYVTTTRQTVIVVSHDKTLLNLLPALYEVSQKGLTLYGGNYDFYAGQKEQEKEALEQDIKDAGKALRKARETAREAMERKQKQDARGKKKQEKEGLPTISMNTFRNNAEKSTARMKDVHEEKTEDLTHQLKELRKELPAIDTMKLALANPNLHRGKLLIKAAAINVSFNSQPLWKQPLSMEIRSGRRMVIRGNNGSGKTTLLRLLQGQLLPDSGTVEKADITSLYIDQDYSVIAPALSVYEQACGYNHQGLQEHEIKSRLSRFLFDKNDWDKAGAVLSGGERMRLLLCMLTLNNHAPDLIILDEPTNNLDIQNLEILTAAMNAYEGTLLVVSHDSWFTEQLQADTVLEL